VLLTSAAAHVRHAGRAGVRRARVDATVEFCERYDENCFDPDDDWLPLEHFAPAVEEVFSRGPTFR
jgi:hypothetical protein